MPNNVHGTANLPDFWEVDPIQLAGQAPGPSRNRPSPSVKCDFQKEMARETGLEPATSGVTGRRSNQLSYSPAVHRRQGRVRCENCGLRQGGQLVKGNHPIFWVTACVRWKSPGARAETIPAIVASVGRPLCMEAAGL